MTNLRSLESSILHPCKQCRTHRIRCTFNRQLSRHGTSATSGKPSTGYQSIEASTAQEKNSTTATSSESQSLAHEQRGWATNTSPTSTPTLVTRPLRFRHHHICGQGLFNDLMTDYLEKFIALHPLVHEVAFVVDLQSDRVSKDALFFSLVTCIAAFVSSSLPRKFSDYDSGSWLFPCQNPIDVVAHCESIVVSFRPWTYYEHSTQEKCAIAYLLAVSCSNIGLIGRGAAYYKEVLLHLDNMNVALPSGHHELSSAESQLRKKTFWSCVFMIVHQRLQPSCILSQLWHPLPQRMLFDAAHLGELMPRETSDEDALGDTFHGDPSYRICADVVFRIMIQIYSCFVDGTESVPAFEKTIHNSSSNGCNMSTGEALDKFEKILIMIEAIQKDLLLRMTFLRERDKDPEPAVLDSCHLQRDLESVQINACVTVLWARSLVLSRLAEFRLENGDNADSDQGKVWTEQEDICEELLQMLSKVRLQSLQPGGILLSFKIRQITSSLVGHSSSSGEDIGERSRGLFDRLMKILTDLNNYTLQDRQITQGAAFFRAAS